MSNLLQRHNGLGSSNGLMKAAEERIPVAVVDNGKEERKDKVPNREVPCARVRVEKVLHCV